MASTFILRFGYRRVVVFSGQCKQYSDVIALARSTFASLRSTDEKDIVIVGAGSDCPWSGEAELSGITWEFFNDILSEATVVLRHEREKLESPGL